ncbi:unnamed protein product, partial [Allacma fusca]
RRQEINQGKPSPAQIAVRLLPVPSAALVPHEEPVRVSTIDIDSESPTHQVPVPPNLLAPVPPNLLAPVPPGLVAPVPPELVAPVP